MKTNCPICNSTLIKYGAEENFSKVYINKTFYKCQMTELTMVKGSYELKTHYSTEYRDYKFYSENIVIYPFIIESYKDVSNLYIYDKDRSAKRFIVEIPYLDLQWNNKDVILNKLKLYTAFS